MEIRSIVGLPAHPLLVHLPVVLVPLTAAAAAVAVAVRRLRRILAPVVAAMALVALLGAVFAAGSGEALRESLTTVDTALVDRHAELGETLRNLTALMLVAAVVFALAAVPDRLGLRDGSVVGRVVRRRGVLAGSAVALIVVAGLATAWAVRAGHTGAEAVWKDALSTHGASLPSRAAAARVPAP